METNKRALKNIIIFLSIGILVLFMIFVINQITQIFVITSNIHPLLGRGVLIVLTAFFGIAIIVPILGFLRLPGALIPPDQQDKRAYAKYIDQLKKRIISNPHLKKEGFLLDVNADCDKEVERAMYLLNEKARDIVKSNASTVFTTTAISQNGALDGVFVFISLTSMVWKIAHLYNQRPSLRDLWVLYINVGATVLLAREIDDLNLLDEQLEPVIASLLGGTLGNLVPGATFITNLVVNSITEGAANAFLTLRVGAITIQYCSSLHKTDRKILRRSATLEACGMLNSIIQENSMAITKAFLEASKKVAVNTLTKSKHKLSQLMRKKNTSDKNHMSS